MTEKLYYIDSFCKEFDACVLACEAKDEKYAVLLDRTAFFPEGGGQSGDVGTLGDAVVFDTRETNGEVWHYTHTPLSVGEQVHGVLDFAKRFQRMQCHSGEHIVSGLIHALFGFDNVGFHLGDTDVTIDINGVLTDADLRRVEALANEAIAKDLAIRAWFPESAEATALPYRAKLTITEGLRLVEFPGYDICACCAPHVHTTGQIGVIKLLDFANYKGGVRIHMLCGEMAREDYHKRYTSVKQISELLSAKQGEVAEAVERLKAENEAHIRESGALKKALAESMAASAAPTDGNLLFFAPLLDAVSLRTLVNAALPKCDGICAAFSGGDGAYTFCMASKSINLREKAKEIGEALHGRGGGSPEMI
ncbi:MAG: alanyl-tRNA editing protein, partial [Clostridia bacterium]|nr:alanyl-tRNA editing protein [Clostridia bacterium]